MIPKKQQIKNFEEGFYFDKNLILTYIKYSPITKRLYFSREGKETRMMTQYDIKNLYTDYFGEYIKTESDNKELLEKYKIRENIDLQKSSEAKERTRIRKEKKEKTKNIQYYLVDKFLGLDKNEIKGQKAMMLIPEISEKLGYNLLQCKQQDVMYIGRILSEIKYQFLKN